MYQTNQFVYLKHVQLLYFTIWNGQLNILSEHNKWKYVFMQLHILLNFNKTFFLKPWSVIGAREVAQW